MQPAGTQPFTCELDESKLSFVSLIELTRSTLSFRVPRVNGVTEPGYMSRKIRKCRTDKFDT